jgi:hypothetical protein
MDVKKPTKIIKPTLTTYKKLIGQLFYIYIETIVNDISKELNLTAKLKGKLLDHIMTESDTLFKYKILNNKYTLLKS